MVRKSKLEYKTKKTTCPICKEEYLRTSYCDKPHLCKAFLPYHDMIEVHHIRAEVKILNPLAKIPDQHDAWNIGYDLSSVENFTVPSHGTANIPTGIALSVPLGFYFTIEPRSSLAIKGIFPIGGVVDSTYTGMIFVMLVNVTDIPYKVIVGDRIAQAIFHKGYLADITTVKRFSPEYDLRGTRGFGSSGR